MKARRISRISRRDFVAASAAAVTAFGCRAPAVRPGAPTEDDDAIEIIDIHQHTNYHDRIDEDLVKHQRAMGVAKTVLLPAGSKYGLAARCGGNETVLRVVRAYPDEFVFFANELPDIDETRREIVKYLELGAIGIGEQKFNVRSDSEHIELIASIAKEYDVPVLLHFQHGSYNLEFERFHRILEKFPTVNFIGHAQTWWANIDRDHADPNDLYPTGPVTPGGLTDRYLSDYPNMYGDLSAGSGLNALLRDEGHTRGFLHRHQDKLLLGTDCDDIEGRGEKCQGAGTIAAVRRLAPGRDALRKIFNGNARRIMRL